MSRTAWRLLFERKNGYCQNMRTTNTIHAEPEEYYEHPIYRVNFWECTSQGSYNLDARIIVDASDIEEVQHWIMENAQGRIYELFVECNETDGVTDDGWTPRTATLIRLAGRNPN